MNLVTRWLVLAAMLVATGANAQILLNANDCQGGGLQPSILNACASGQGVCVVGSAIIPPITVEGWGGTESVIEVTTDAGTLPDWWRLNSCGALSSTRCDAYSWRDPSACPSLWYGPDVAYGTMDMDEGWARPGVLQITITTHLVSENPNNIHLPDTLRGDGVTELNVFRLRVDNSRSASCGGCEVPACITYRSLTFRSTDTLRPDWVVLQAGPGSVVRYNGVATSCAEATPVRNRTWGAIKSLYR